jgi:hypothetical protein
MLGLISARLKSRGEYFRKFDWEQANLDGRRAIFFILLNDPLILCLGSKFWTYFLGLTVVLLILPQIRPLSYLCLVNLMSCSLNPIYPMRVSFFTRTILKNRSHLKKGWEGRVLKEKKMKNEVDITKYFERGGFRSLFFFMVQNSSNLKLVFVDKF